MRLLYHPHGNATAVAAATSLATSTTPPSRRDQQELLTDHNAASKCKGSNEEDTDTGILLLSSTTTTASDTTRSVANMPPVSKTAPRRSLLLLTTATLLTTRTSVAQQCSTDIVDCVYGMVRDDNTTTCADACGSDCCVGLKACNDFTGQLCKDGSCTGAYACTYAYIPSVVDSCKGDYACYKTGYYGYVGTISTSCHGIDACCYLGSYGDAGDILDACRSYQACDSVAYKGYIGHLTSSCKNASYACLGAGSPTNGTGTIPYDLVNCCNDEESICFEANKDTLPTECWYTKVRKTRRRCVFVIIIVLVNVMSLLCLFFVCMTTPLCRR